MFIAGVEVFKRAKQNCKVLGAEAVRTLLQEAVGEEDKRKPLSDEKLMKVLQDKGYQIARRTVAKYREQLGIPVARLRKEL